MEREKDSIVRYDAAGAEEKSGIDRWSSPATCDSGGRLWVSSCPYGEAFFSPACHVECFGPDLEPAGRTEIRFLTYALAIDRRSGRAALAPRGRHVYAARTDPGNTLSALAPYDRAHRVTEGEEFTVTGLAFDPDGRLFAATADGAQVFDPTGRLCGVLTSPVRDNPPEYVAVGGPKFDGLFASFGDAVYWRPIKLAANK